MTPALIFNLLISALLFGAQLMLRPDFYGERGRIIFLRTTRISFWILLLGNLFLAGYLTYQQYFIWLAHPLAKILLPPYQGWQYFISYALLHFYLIPALLGSVSLSVLVITKLTNKKFQGRFFESAEPYLAGLSILSVGNPAWIYYLGAVFIGGLIIGIGKRTLFKEKEFRFSLYYLWLPISALVIIVSKVFL